MCPDEIALATATTLHYVKIIYHKYNDFYSHICSAPNTTLRGTHSSSEKGFLQSKSISLPPEPVSSVQSRVGMRLFCSLGMFTERDTNRCGCRNRKKIIIINCDCSLVFAREVETRGSGIKRCSLNVNNFHNYTIIVIICWMWDPPHASSLCFIVGTCPHLSPYSHSRRIRRIAAEWLVMLMLLFFILSPLRHW